MLPTEQRKGQGPGRLGSHPGSTTHLLVPDRERRILLNRDLKELNCAKRLEVVRGKGDGWGMNTELQIQINQVLALESGRLGSVPSARVWVVHHRVGSPFPSVSPALSFIQVGSPLGQRQSHGLRLSGSQHEAALLLLGGCRSCYHAHR